MNKGTYFSYEMESLISLWLVRAEKHSEIVQRNSRR